MNRCFVCSMTTIECFLGYRRHITYLPLLSLAFSHSKNMQGLMWYGLE